MNRRFFLALSILTPTGLFAKTQIKEKASIDSDQKLYYNKHRQRWVTVTSHRFEFESGSPYYSHKDTMFPILLEPGDPNDFSGMTVKILDSAGYLLKSDFLHAYQIHDTKNNFIGVLIVESEVKINTL